jgi:hypothetical protein
VRKAIAAAFASAQTVSGVFVNREQAGGGENRWRFVFSSSGSFRITAIGSPVVTAYDSRSNIEYNSDLGLFTRRTGLAPGRPDSGPADWIVQRDLGTVVAALAAAGDVKVKEVDYEGRPAWLLRTPTGNPGEERAITVDRETGIPVKDVRFRAGRYAGEWQIEHLRLDTRLPKEASRLARKPGQQLTQYDMGFERVPLEEVSANVGYRPLVPGWLPDGYERDLVAIARSSRPTGDEQHMNPPSREVVSQRYRRGLDEIVITTRLTGRDASRWGDPVIGSSVRAAQPERVTFAAGALQGRRGEVVIDPNSAPHMWTVAGRLVVTIAGNADRAELLRIAESLRAG